MQKRNQKLGLEAAENAYRDPRDQISYTKTVWKCPCNGCKKAQKLERERIAGLIQEQHLLSASGELRRYGSRTVECMTLNTLTSLNTLDSLNTL